MRIIISDHAKQQLQKRGSEDTELRTVYAAAARAARRVPTLPRRRLTVFCDRLPDVNPVIEVGPHKAVVVTVLPVQALTGNSGEAIYV